MLKQQIYCLPYFLQLLQLSHFLSSLSLVLFFCFQISEIIVLKQPRQLIATKANASPKLPFNPGLNYIYHPIKAPSGILNTNKLHFLSSNKLRQLAFQSSSLVRFSLSFIQLLAGIFSSGELHTAYYILLPSSRYFATPPGKTGRRGGFLSRATPARSKRPMAAGENR